MIHFCPAQSTATWDVNERLTELDAKLNAWSLDNHLKMEIHTQQIDALIVEIHELHQHIQRSSSSTSETGHDGHARPSVPPDQRNIRPGGAQPRFSRSRELATAVNSTYQNNQNSFYFDGVIIQP